MKILRFLVLTIYLVQTKSRSLSSVSFVSLFVLLMIALVPALANAQTQTGSIQGKVTVMTGGVSPADVEVIARSNVMPRSRTTTTKADGSFALPQLIPGVYRVSFTFSDGSVRTTQRQVLLGQSAEIVLDYAEDSLEVVTVVGNTLIAGRSSLSNAFDAELLEALPTGQNYREMLKILPGVAYTENSTLGPSAGGSGVDNSYAFDGVDLSLPLFGNLSSEPSTHDIASVSVDRGAAKAIGFNRSGGFTVNAVSKSGTNEFHGNIEYRLENADFSALPEQGAMLNTDRLWLIGALSGPVIEDRLFFYASYFRPEETGDDRTTAYGAAKKFNSVRDEFFAKLTWAPSDDLLINVSQRSSERVVSGGSISELEADSVSEGSAADLSIFSLDGVYLFGEDSSATLKYGRYKENTTSQPDVVLSFVPRVGDALDVTALDTMGYFNVPVLREGDAIFNTGAASLIGQYGYEQNGVRLGGGSVGAYSEFNNQDFARESIELTYGTEFEISDMTHDLHIGFKWSELEENLGRTSNGWGAISYLGGEATDDAQSNVFFQSQVEQMSFLDEDGNSVRSIVSSIESYNIEINDTIILGDFTLSIGALISRDVLYGQGLRKNASNFSGFELAPGSRYEMYATDWQDMIQPRLGLTWAYEDRGTVFANYARYSPQATSLARAASWARDDLRSIAVNFDAAGNYLGSGAAQASSGKFFADNMQPRRIDEFTVGVTNAVTDQLALRSHLRYRHGTHFWEDMPNDARLYGDYTGGSVPANIAAKGEYIPELDAYRAEVGGSSFVIAEVDGGETKYWEWSLESEWRGERSYVIASYVWSHYYGNFDQDNTTTDNDANTFIGSSFYGDGPGRMVWDRRYGELIGDKPHKLKVQGYYELNWNATVGAFLVYQSGEAWAAWDGALYGYSSSTSRYAEAAGSRRGASHWQMDVNYTQNYVLSDGVTLKFRADIYNTFNNQTGYNYEPVKSDMNFGNPRSYYSPRRVQLSIGLTF
ncbi:MAG: carboxypeptidase regulatory-like domain-containing protein [Haliea sp.]|jgi:hypothetical protein|nr:carboxypeptidase regulatory-like domain-containing protein [Haliea sp.]